MCDLTKGRAQNASFKPNRKTIPCHKLLCLSVFTSVCLSEFSFSTAGLYRSFLSVCLFVCSDEELTLETSAAHHIPQAKNIPYQPLLIKPWSNPYSAYSPTQKKTHFFSKLVFQCLFVCLCSSFRLSVQVSTLVCLFCYLTVYSSRQFI